MNLPTEYFKQKGRLWPEIGVSEEYLIRNYIDRYHRGEERKSLESAINLLVSDAMKYHAGKLKRLSYRELLGYDGNMAEGEREGP